MADNQGYIKQLWKLENEAKEGFNSKTGKWTGNAAPEKGGKTDYGPGLKLPYKQGGYTQAEIDKAVTDKITGIESTLKKDVAKLGKNYDNLSETQKKLLVDYSYNTGNAFADFPKFSKAVVEGDVKGMNAEYKRYWVDKSGTRREVQERNEWTKSQIDGFGK
jgi:GH24 family phage-related lysozyme (muramidase)